MDPGVFCSDPGSIFRITSYIYLPNKERVPLFHPMPNLKSNTHAQNQDELEAMKTQKRSLVSLLAPGQNLLFCGSKVLDAGCYVILQLRDCGFYP